MIQEVVQEEVISKISPWKRVGALMKKLLTAVIVLKWLVEILKFIGTIAAKCADQTRRAIKLSITDKYDEGKVWVTILWLKFWWLVIGLVAMYLLHYFGLLESIDSWINNVA
jgi:hypothetical protein